MRIRKERREEQEGRDRKSIAAWWIAAERAQPKHCQDGPLAWWLRVGSQYATLE